MCLPPWIFISKYSKEFYGLCTPPEKKFRWGRAPSRFGAEKHFLVMYLTIPVTSATSEHTFSALRRLKNYLRSTMKQDHLNNCPLTSCHKLIMDTPDTVKIPCANKQRNGHFGKFV